MDYAMNESILPSADMMEAIVNYTTVFPIAMLIIHPGLGMVAAMVGDLTTPPSAAGTVGTAS